MTQNEELNSISLEIKKLEPKSGDMFVFRSNHELEEILPMLVMAKQKLVDEGINPVFIIGDNSLDITQIPEEALKEQGYVRIEDVLHWIQSAAPLRYRGKLLVDFSQKFDAARRD
jgi:uncharacterized Fe-S cluster-containing radical SAM superfamily enzyme